MYLCTSGSNRDTISYFPFYMKQCTVSQVNNDEGETLFCTRCSLKIGHVIVIFIILIIIVIVITIRSVIMQNLEVVASKLVELWPF